MILLDIDEFRIEWSVKAFNYVRLFDQNLDLFVLCLVIVDLISHKY
jgi:hypothetical protein